MPADTPAMAQFSALLLEFEFAVQNEMRAEERDAPFDRLARASDKVDAARAALLAAVERGEAETRTIEKAFLAGYEYAVGAEALGADVGFEARQYAARAHPPIQETDADAE